MNTPARPKSNSMRQRGFTMIEVLVSALILVVGVLGVAALQVTALKNLQSSGNYGVASLVANEMVDRIWVNGEEALTNDAYLHTQPPANTPRNCEDETCTAAQLADYDIWDWQRQLTGYTVSDVEIPAILPSAQGRVVAGDNAGEFDVIVRWDDNLDGSTGTNCPPQTDADLDCYSVTITITP